MSNGLKYALCLLGSFFVGYFNPRKVGVIGSLISASSLLASAYITHIIYYIFTYGIIDRL